MKMIPEYAEIQENMKPGKITVDGFLGNDGRNITDIISADEEEFSQLDLDFSEVAKLLRELLREGAKGLGKNVKYGKWEIAVNEARGNIPCPFKDGMFSKRVATIRNLNNSQEIVLSDLSVHLLEKHHFLQGRGSTFRLEPSMIKIVLYE
ncbi:MAG TPA: hypothetical protein PKI14_16095 [Fervidobacterium sp.]|nr:hypothetical protein [Fervidobacterium sp.]HOQ40458.1 hypothetical protein [Fervidobacterium sp.]HPT55010.1 hypothetical protein [Fervidobacterium sp.]HQE50173.1 hypothetical protein [Fervidobacterium sp.]HUM44466.1 hypothetical protein [Fervidobacterium sp.]